jgi:ABC-type transport system involved in multi-copper enzyme maturation permease subunit
MRQVLTIAVNAFMELIRQPVFLLLATSACVFNVFLAAVPYMALGDDPKLVKDSVLAVTFVTGLLGAVLSASSSVAREIRTGTALAVLSKPVSRPQFLLAKFLGVAGALTVLTYINLLSVLLASRMAYDAYGDADVAGTSVYYGAIILAYIVAGISNYFLRRPFASDGVIAMIVTTTIAFIIITNFMVLKVAVETEPNHVDIRMVQVTILILFALWILAAIALLCSTRLEVIPTLAICSGVFVLGLMSDYLFGRPAEAGALWAKVLYTITPNWQLFWTADTLEPGKQGVPWSYVAQAFGYVVGYLGAALMVALYLFEDRELN